ncbi:MAG: nickel pincer cofactor biosynthesis protein LarC, partial [Planctomycetota bacterium]
MTLAYFDCFAGAGGDMIVGALVDAGADADRLAAELSKLGLGEVAVTCEPANRSGIVGTWVRVDDSKADHPGRHLGDILGLIQAADLPGESGAMAERVFQRLATAEAAVHNTSIDEVHFHEVGAVDSIVDVVGACVALELLGVTQLICSPIATGHGTVTCDHGTFPVPAPATARLLADANAPTNPIDQASEVTTPTAAAVLTTLAESFGPMPAMAVIAVGYGAG